MQLGQVIRLAVTLGVLGLLEARKSSRANHDEPETSEFDMGLSEEKRLIGRLLGRYKRMGKAGRPVLNSSSPIIVWFGLGLVQMDLDEKDKVLTMSMWSRYRWTDEYLRWDPAEYGGVTTINVEPEDIWIPDIMLYNTADVSVPTRYVLAKVDYTGDVFWYPHCIYRSSCSVDVTNFPFDNQTCNMAFGSWTHAAKELDLNMSVAAGIDLSTFLDNHKDSSAWEVLDVTANKSVQDYVVLTFQIHMQRKMVFSSYILTLPCIFLASLTLVIFWLPPERPDRTSLGMSTFSSFMLLFLILVEAAPPTTNTVPTLGVYYCINLVVIMLSIIFSSMVVNISRGPTDKISPVPSWIVFLTLKILSRVLFVKSATEASHLRFHPEDTPKNNRCNDGMRPTIHTLFCRKSAKNKSHQHEYESNSLLRNTDGLSNDLNCNKDTRSDLQRSGVMDDIYQCLKRIEATVNQRQQKQQKQQKILWQWKCVANVMDRLFFVLYVILNTFSLALFFPRPEHFWDSLLR